MASKKTAKKASKKAAKKHVAHPGAKKASIRTNSTGPKPKPKA